MWAVTRKRPKCLWEVTASKQHNFCLVVPCIILYYHNIINNEYYIIISVMIWSCDSYTCFGVFKTTITITTTMRIICS